MRLTVIGARAIATLAVALAWSPAVDAQTVDEARAHYNAGRFADAIATAGVLWSDTGRPEAGLVLGRAGLEQFRVTEDPADLEAARMTLGRLDPLTLPAAQVREWEVGVAQTLFLQGQFGAAAELFRRLLATADPSSLRSRDRLLDWWATAVDRVAGGQTLPARAEMYGDLLERLQAEAVRSPTSASVPFWMAATARAAGAPERAWHLAVAGWVLAPRAAQGQERLRADLDRLVLQGIVPDLATLRTGAGIEDEATVNAMAELAAEWAALTEAWPSRAYSSVRSATNVDAFSPR